MSLITVIVLLAVLAIVLYGIWIAARELTEFEHAFTYGVFGFLFLLVGAAVYLAIATPTLALKSNGSSSVPGMVIQDDSNLLAE